MEREPGRRFRLDGPFAVVAGRDLDVDASGAPLGVGVLDLRIRVEHAPLGIDRQAELLGHAAPLGVGSPAAVFRPRGLAPARDSALEFAVEPYAPDGGAPLEQALAFAAAGPVDGRVVRELGVLEEARAADLMCCRCRRGFGGPGTCEPDLLAGIDSPLGGQLPGLGHAFPREGQHLERVAVGSGGSGFLGEPFADPGVDGPPRGVRMPAEVSLGEIAVRDGAVDADVGERPTAPFAEGGGPAVPARGVFSAMAVPHAIGSAAGWRGGTRVRFDRAVEHLLGLRPWPQRLGLTVRVGTGSGSSGRTEG